MIFYKDEDLKKIEKTRKKWTIFIIIFTIFAIGLFTLFIVFSNYQYKLLFQLLASFSLAIYGVILVFLCDSIFIKAYCLKKHYVLIFLSGSDKHVCKVKEISKPITISNKISAYPVTVLIDEKEIVYYLLESFSFDFSVGDQLNIETKNRFIFSIEEIIND